MYLIKDGFTNNLSFDGLTINLISEEIRGIVWKLM